MRPLSLRSILVATDLSADDVAALRAGIALARLTDARLHVVHAAPADGDAEAAVARQIREADPTCEPLPEITVRNGAAHQVIVSVARRVDADVIVLGPHRADQPHSPTGTAYRVVASAGRPCLVLPAEIELPLGRILVPIDAAGGARGALAVAMTWASALRRRTRPDAPDSTALVVLHVETPADPGDSAGVLDSAMSSVGEHVSQLAGVRVERITLSGDDAAAAILEHATKGSFDLIALGTRGELGGGAELGSVSSAVVQSASCPLLLVPPRVWRELGDDPLP